MNEMSALLVLAGVRAYVEGELMLSAQSPDFGDR